MEGSAPDRSSLSFRKMRPSDIDSVLEACIAGSEPTFSFRLGPRFLRSQFSAFLDSREACAITCWDDAAGQLVGYVCGTQDLAKHYRVWLRRNLLHWQLLAVLLRDPAIALGLVKRGLRLFQIISGSRSDKDRARKQLEPSRAVLMQVLVRPERRREGVGSLLVEAFADAMARRGMARVELWVRSNNAAARRVYEHLGWIAVRPESDTRGLSRWLYRLDLPSSGQVAPTLNLSANQSTGTGSQVKAEGKG